MRGHSLLGQRICSTEKKGLARMCVSEEVVQKADDGQCVLTRPQV